MKHHIFETLYKHLHRIQAWRSIIATHGVEHPLHLCHLHTVQSSLGPSNPAVFGQGPSGPLQLSPLQLSPLYLDGVIHLSHSFLASPQKSSQSSSVKTNRIQLERFFMGLLLSSQFKSIRSDLFFHPPGCFSLPLLSSPVQSSSLNLSYIVQWSQPSQILKWILTSCVLLLLCIEATGSQAFLFGLNFSPVAETTKMRLHKSILLRNPLLAPKIQSHKRDC